MVLLGAGVFLLAASYLWGPLFWLHARLLYWQRECLNYRAEPSSLVLNVDDMKDVASHPSRQWDELYALLSPPGKQPSSMLFLGPIPTSDGTARLVALDLFNGNLASSRQDQRLFMIRLTVVKPGLIGAPAIVEQKIVSSLSARSLEIYAGQLAAGSNPPRVMFDAVLDGQRYAFAIELADDNTPSLEQTDVTPPAP